MDNQFAPQIWSDIYNFVGEFINPTTKDMKSFQTDVRYDIVTLTRLFDGNETKKVYWSVRETGTFLVKPTSWLNLKKQHKNFEIAIGNKKVTARLLTWEECQELNSKYDVLTTNIINNTIYNF